MYKNRLIFTITFDVEEWFQVENLRMAIPVENWEEQNSSVERNINKILKILKSENIEATFFILGWIVERYPELIRKIFEDGHEIASHGYRHQVTSSLTKKELKKDIIRSKEILEKIIGTNIKGYRAPNFSISDRVVDVLKEIGFLYDSSYNPFQIHDRYGSLKKYQVKNNTITLLKNGLYEVPVSAVKIFKKPFPIGGGAYFRILPFTLFSFLVKKKLKQDGFFNFYLHPWEFEPDQPRIKNISLNHYLRHYTGLKKTEIRFKKLITNLKKQDCQFITISDYLSNNKK